MGFSAGSPRGRVKGLVFGVSEYGHPGGVNISLPSCGLFFLLPVISQCCGTHNAVEAVEGGVEVGLFAQAIHLHHHLRQKYPQEDELSKIYIRGGRWGERRRRRISSKVTETQSIICKISSHLSIWGVWKKKKISAVFVWISRWYFHFAVFFIYTIWMKNKAVSLSKPNFSFFNIILSYPLPPGYLRWEHLSICGGNLHV